MPVSLTDFKLDDQPAGAPDDSIKCSAGFAQRRQSECWRHRYRQHPRTVRTRAGKLLTSHDESPMTDGQAKVAR
jgi:hypothetical protein